MATNATLADFRARGDFAAFADTPDEVVETALADAAAECSTRFGDDLVRAQCLLAAHKLALGSFGQEDERGEEGRTRYLAEWERLARVHFGGPYVIGM